MWNNSKKQSSDQSEADILAAVLGLGSNGSLTADLLLFSL